MTNKTENIFEFTPFQLDGRQRRLLRDGETITLDGKAVDLLLALVIRAGDIVKKDELMNAVWPECCVEEANISRQVWAIRQALGSSAFRSEGGGEEYIQTIKGRGYRFVARVRAISDAPPGAENGHGAYSNGRHSSFQSWTAMSGSGANGTSARMGTIEPNGHSSDQHVGEALALGAIEPRNGSGNGHAGSGRPDLLHVPVASGMGPGISGSLRRSLAPFIGRETDVEAVKALIMDEKCRLITLTGAPGVGKTRLALEVAEQVSADFPDGGYFVPLEQVTDPGLVLAELGRVLTGERFPAPVASTEAGRAFERTSPSEVLSAETSFRAKPTVPALARERCPCGGAPELDSLSEFLGYRRALLVIDNFEHLLAASEILTGLIASCPNLKVLVTSRSTLHFVKEVEYMVKPVRPGRLW